MKGTNPTTTEVGSRLMPSVMVAAGAAVVRSMHHPLLETLLGALFLLVFLLFILGFLFVAF